MPIQPPEPDYLEAFEDCVLFSHPTGSRYICNPPVMDTDNDTVILVNGYYDYADWFDRNGWENCGNYEFAGRFVSYRKGEENYIVTEDRDFFLRYIFATEGAKALNLLKKEDRITLFQAIADAPEGLVGLGKLVQINGFLNPMFTIEPRVVDPLI